MCSRPSIRDLELDDRGALGLAGQIADPSLASIEVMMWKLPLGHQIAMIVNGHIDDIFGGDSSILYYHKAMSFGVRRGHGIGRQRLHR